LLYEQILILYNTQKQPVLSSFIHFFYCTIFKSISDKQLFVPYQPITKKDNIFIKNVEIVWKST